VLLVEDDPVNSTLISRMLARLGAVVQTRANGEEALEAIAMSPFDVILMDCHMPVLDGFEATRRLRTRESQEGMGAHATVIALTASVLEEDRRRCLEAGMDSFLSKPVRLADLSKALAPYVGAAPS
jgi:CheY-like chemotaxis protein